MASIKLHGVGRWDGTYELNVDDRAFNAREWRWIKQIAGYMPATIADGFAGNDPDLFVSLAVVAMCRAGKIERDQALRVADEIAETPYVGQQTIELIGDPDEEAADESPLDLGSESGESSPTDSLSNSDTPKPNGNSSGSTSMSDSGASVETPSPTTA